jgi:hypothetical protein
MFNWLRRLCRKTNPREEFIFSCENRDNNKAKKILEDYPHLSINECLVTACMCNNTELATWLVEERKALNLNECLVIACKNNCYSIAELLAKNGANRYAGLPYSSGNITQMLYRY